MTISSFFISLPSFTLLIIANLKQKNTAYARIKSMTASKKGFVLTIVIVVGTVLMITIAYVMRSVNSGRIILSNQHNQLLARQAAESGIAMAEACLAESGNAVTWSNTKPLRPNTDCYGTESDDPNVDKWVYVDADEVTKTTFRVEPVSSSENNIAIKARGSVEIYGGGGSTLTRSFDHEMSTYVKFQLSFADIGFGSIYSAGSRVDGSLTFVAKAYFIARADPQTVYGVGANASYAVIGPAPDNTRPPSSFLKPTKVVIPNNKQVYKIFTDFSGNGWSVGYIMTDGSVYISGTNYSGQVGNGLRTTSTEWPLSWPYWPDDAQRDISMMNQVVRLTVGGSVQFTHALTDSGECCDVYANGLPLAAAGLKTLEYRLRPEKIDLPLPVTGFHVDKFYDQSPTVLAILSNGELWGWGSNRLSQISNPSCLTTSCATPSRVWRTNPSLDNRVVSAVTDGGSTWLVQANGDLYSKGVNDYGQLGRTTLPTDSMLPIAKPTGSGKFIKAFTDSYNVYFLDSLGQIYGAGLNNVGQLGDSSVINRSRLVKFNLPVGVRVTDFTTCSPNINGMGDEGLAIESHDYRNAFAIGSDGRVYGAGSNYYGQLGVGTAGGYRSTPVAMDPSIIDGVKVRAKYVRCGIGTTVVITESNKVYTVGNNNNGQLGNGLKTNTSTPDAHQYTNPWGSKGLYF